ncbi:oxysterol-binding protein-related protein 5 isoform 2 [Camelus ferus]|nr:oxysterol-binding protein-related protein 5 isoform 2 [Camelus ferus]
MSPESEPDWKDMEPNGPSPPKDEGPLTPGLATKVPPAECRLCSGSDRECVSPTAKGTKKETLKAPWAQAQKESYRQEKKRATRQLLSALTDPGVVIMADSLKIRGTLKSWTKLWCVLKPGVLLIYKTPKVGQWVGTVLLHCCELIERPSKKDGFCFKLFHPLDQSVWAVKGPKGESVGSITQPLPSSYLIFRAASESDASQVETVSEENKSLMWVLLKQLRPGMDLSRVVLPTFVLEPRSFLNKLSDYYCHADLLSRAALEEDAYSRIKHVLRWYLSGFYKKPKGIRKPYNPILGETFRCCWFHPQTNSHTFYIAEQARTPAAPRTGLDAGLCGGQGPGRGHLIPVHVSHHPPVSAFHVSNRKDGFCISGSITAKSRFYGNSLSALLDGKATLTFLNRAEDYTLTMPYAHCKAAGASDPPGRLGQDREVFIKEEGRGGTELFWNPSGEVRGQRLKRHTVLFEEQTELESERLWQHVTRAISDGDQHRATQEKFSLEEAQRQRARERQQNLVPWTPRLFHLDPATQEWRYRYENHRPWDPLKDIAQFEQDGVLHTLQRETMAHQTTFLGSPGPRHQPLLHQLGACCAHSREDGARPCSPFLPSGPDFPSCESPCPRCRKEARRLQVLHEAILSTREAQQELHRHLSAMLSSTAQARQAPAPGLLHSPRSWFLLCVFLACQLLINYILK